MKRTGRLVSATSPGDDVPELNEGRKPSILDACLETGLTISSLLSKDRPAITYRSWLFDPLPARRLRRLTSYSTFFRKVEENLAFLHYNSSLLSLLSWGILLPRFLVKQKYHSIYSIFVKC